MNSVYFLPHLGFKIYENKAETANKYLNGGSLEITFKIHLK